MAAAVAEERAGEACDQGNEIRKSGFHSVGLCFEIIASYCPVKMSFLIGDSLFFIRESDRRTLFDMGAFPFIHGR